MTSNESELLLEVDCGRRRNEKGKGSEGRRYVGNVRSDDISSVILCIVKGLLAYVNVSSLVV